MGMEQAISAVFEDNNRSLLKVDDDDFFDVNVSLVEEASGRDTPVIYVATKRPYLMMRDALQENGVEHDIVHFVDCIVKTLTNEKVPEDEGVLYLNRTDDLSNISTAVSSIDISTGKKGTVLIIDSLAALLAAHPTEKVARFITDTQERVETTEMNLVLFDEGSSVEKEVGKEIYETIDNVLFLRGMSG